MVEKSPAEEDNNFKSPQLPIFVGVQYLRAFAAIAVVLFHAAQRYGYDFNQGARGVDVFFVISGFIMWSLTASRSTTPTEFLVNRIKRIVPLYWLATGVIIVTGIMGVYTDGKVDLSFPAILKSLFFVPYIANGATEIWPILTPGWTLNYEMFFYAVFAGFLITPSRFRLIGLSATFISLIGLGILLEPRGPVLVTYTHALIGHFILGVWIAEIVRRGFSLPPITAVLAILIGCVALYVVPWNHVIWTLACGLASALIVAGVVSLDLRNLVPQSAILLFSGNASYSIYLFHGFAISVAAKIATFLGLPDWMACIAGIFGAVTSGMIIYLVIEEPIKRTLSRLKRSQFV